MVCRNLKQSIGITTFKDDREAIKMPVMPDSLQVSPAGDRSTVVVVSLNSFTGSSAIMRLRESPSYLAVAH